MPINNYQGETFVAFTDISGFKVMMKDNQKAVRAIDHFYSAGYRCLQRDSEVNGFFVSDCGILFSRATDHHLGLIKLLKVIESLNRELLRNDIMLTTSVAFGDFSYQQRLEFPGIDKKPIYGNAYLAAFLDNESDRPKMQPGQCRIISRDVGQNVIVGVDRLVKRGSHFYFYWMVGNGDEIQEFDGKYMDAYQLKYRGMLEALKWKGQLAPDLYAESH